MLFSNPGAKVLNIFDICKLFWSYFYFASKIAVNRLNTIYK